LSPAATGPQTLVHKILARHAVATPDAPALPAPVRIDIAYGGSCTAGKREDFDRYHEVLAWAAGRGLRVPEGIEMFLQFGTTAVRDYCEAQGYLDAFARVGATILQPACGACANCGPGTSTRADQVTVSAINRNFPGRGGLGQVWLASPPTVAASAIAGELLSFEDLQARFGSGRLHLAGVTSLLDGERAPPGCA
jgi:3-isopropylmalate/(R)-2-methylmalate dehydratase large subunit